MLTSYVVTWWASDFESSFHESRTGNMQMTSEEIKMADRGASTESFPPGEMEVSVTSGFVYWTTECTWWTLCVRNENKRGKFGACAMKRVAAGAHLPAPWRFEPAKRPDDKTDYCLSCAVSYLGAGNRYSFLHLSGVRNELPFISPSTGKLEQRCIRSALGDRCFSVKFFLQNDLCRTEKS